MRSALNIKERTMSHVKLHSTEILDAQERHKCGLEITKYQHIYNNLFSL